MSDLIERDKAIDALDDFQSDIENCVADAYAIARQRMATIPSAEPTWTDVLAELHSRFDALEKDFRKASAEMSAVIREYVGRPKGEWTPIGAVCEVICRHCIKANGYCQHHWKCPLLTEIAELIEPKDEQSGKE